MDQCQISSIDHKDPESHSRGRCNTKFHHLRWLALFWASVSIILQYIQRLGMSTAILRMVNQTKIYLDEFPDADPNEIDNGEEPGEFEWSYFIQSVIINTYFVGYALPQTYLSRLADIYGMSKLMIISQLLVIVCNLLTPITAKYGWIHLSLLRLILGLANSPQYAITIGMFDRWLYESEHAKCLTMVQFVGNFGVFLAPLIAGYLSSFHYSVFFYTISLATAIWLLVWVTIARDTPEQSWLMSSKELDQLIARRRYQKSLGYKPGYDEKVTSIHHSKDEDKTEIPIVPWIEIFTTRKFYLNVVGWITYDAALITFSNAIPIYLRTIFHMDINTNGQIGFFIQLSTMAAILWAGSLGAWLSDVKKWPAKKKFLLLYSLGAIGSCMMWFIPSFTTSQNVIIFSFMMVKLFHPAIEFVTIGTVLEDWSSFGLTTTMFGFYNSIGNGSSILFSWSMGYTLDYMGASVSTWNMIFIVMGLVNIVGLSTYALSAKLENKPKQHREISQQF